jgi:hypothetical protein
MTYNPNVPNAAQSPGLFPPQNATNFTRLIPIINSDHFFFDTAPTGGNAGQDGVHRQVTMVSRADPTSFLPAGTNGIIYSKLGGSGSSAPWWYNGGYYPLTAVIAMVNFDGTGVVGAQTMRSSYNVASVIKTATGSYTINFTSPLQNDKYIVQLTGMRNNSSGGSGVSNGFVVADAVYTNQVKTTLVNIQFNGGTSTLQDVFMGNVLITGVPA